MSPSGLGVLGALAVGNFGLGLEAPEADVVTAMLNLAAGRMSEAALAKWIQPEQCSSTAKHAKHAKHAKELPVFTARTRKKLETRPGRFRSGSSSEVMRVGESLRSLRSWR